MARPQCHCPQYHCPQCHCPQRRRAVPRIESLEARLALATMYVAPDGNDASSGSADAPWQTLQKAAENQNSRA